MELVGWPLMEVMDAFAPEHFVTLTDLTVGRKTLASLHKKNVQVQRCKVDFWVERHDVDLDEVFAHLFKGSSSLRVTVSPSSIKLESESNSLIFLNWDYANILQTLIAIKQPLDHAAFHLPFFRNFYLPELVERAFLGNEFSFSVLHGTATPPHIHEIFGIVGIPFQVSYEVDAVVFDSHSHLRFPTCTLVLPSWSPTEVIGLFRSIPFAPRINTRIYLSDIDLSVELLDALKAVKNIVTLTAELDGEYLRQTMTKRQVRKLVNQTIIALIPNGLKRLSLSGNFVPTFHI
jgi:hypothetical protein